MLFRIKICGVTTTEDALGAVQAGADAIGVNFFPGSPRFVEESRAREIVAVLPEDVKCVGVFVNADLAALEYAASIGLDAVQLHGDEDAALVAHCRALPVIKSFRVGAEGLAPVKAFLDQCAVLGQAPAMVLLDAYRAGEYGGTGARADWGVAASYSALNGPPLALAGGLTAENVAEAIRAVRPAAVDVASGVELAPGDKDETKMNAFVAAARGAFGQPS
jgi:phosphoribosylanthranilate isomerase